ncbi:MAG: helix-turn-helix domain-containing protein [Desulfobacterales bacterium]|jgi:transcriptional regulator with XRE-family HTH domain|nr:helix-turn-helix domain-containing protein [Desulfobacterales bacterium]
MIQNKIWQKNLVRILDIQGRDYKDLAALMKKSKEYANAIVTGRKPIGKKKLEELLELLNVDLSEFQKTDWMEKPKPEGAPDIDVYTRSEWPENIDINEAVGMLSKIFKSKNQILIRAISANLMAFSETVDAQAEITKMRQEQEVGKSRMAAIERRLDELESENEMLRKRLDPDAAINHR